VEERGRYSNLPAGRLYALRLLLHRDFANRVHEVYQIVTSRYPS
jgi:hypothetical protein